MSDVGVSYDVSYSPNPVACNATLALSGVDINVTLSGFPPVAIGLTPHYSANILSDMVSTVGTPLVNSISVFLGAFAGEFVNGKSFTVASIPSLPYTVEGFKVTLTPSNLSASAVNGMLKISGDFSIA